MTEKGIYKRLNRCYFNQFVVYESDALEDEWFGNPGNESNVWHFVRPREKKEYRLSLNTDTEDIIVEEKEEGKDFSVSCILSKKEYYYSFDGEDATLKEVGMK